MKRNSGKAYPSKTTVNLIYLEHGKNYGIRVSGTFVAFLIVLVILSQFLVTNRLVKVYKYEKEASEAERQLAALEKDNAEYDEILREYQHYYFSADSENNKPYVNIEDVLQLLENRVMVDSPVTAVALNGDVLTVRLYGVNLNQTSGIIATLTADPLVESVEVSTANTHSASGAKLADMIIVLKPEGGAK